MSVLSRFSFIHAAFCNEIPGRLESASRLKLWRLVVVDCRSRLHTISGRRVVLNKCPDYPRT